jgi:uncharacterized protein Yka (UPF0111/DUF47 family)
MFSSLMPQRREFFELLAAHAEQVAAGANATLRLINGLGDGSGNAAALVAEVNLNEKNADQIKAKVISRLHQSFTTPINRGPDPFADQRTRHDAQCPAIGSQRH